MHRTMIFKAILVWLLIVVLAVVNGLLREFMLVPYLGAQWALPTSGIILSLLVLLACFYLQPWVGFKTSTEAYLVGLTWVVLTLSFEFIFGHYILQQPWSEIAQVFNVKAGNLFVLVLGVCWFGPWLVLKLNIHNH